MLRYQKRTTDETDVLDILTAAAATGVGTTIDVRDYRHIVLQVSAALNSSLTFKIQGSVQSTAPTFSDAQAEANHWDYLAAYDLNDANAMITGDTGVTLNNDSVANNCHLYLVNVDLVRWLNVVVTSYTDGNVTVKLVAAND